MPSPLTPPPSPFPLPPLQVVDEETLQPLWEGRDSSQGISELDYSPTGRMLAAATFDCWLDLYNVEKGYQRVGECVAGGPGRGGGWVEGGERLGGLRG